MLKKKLSILLAVSIFGCSVFSTNVSQTQAAGWKWYYGSVISWKQYIDEYIRSISKEKDTETTAQQETTAQETETQEIEAGETTAQQETTAQETEASETTMQQETEAQETEASETTTQQETTQETLTQETEAQETFAQQETTVQVETTVEKVQTTIPEAYTVEEETTQLNEKAEYFKKTADAEAEWLWSQQLSNGAFAFYNASNGEVLVNPYFSEEVAIALINHDNSPEAFEKIRKYFDWHFSHINTAETDYNGLAGTIYDYKVQVSNGIVVGETSKNSYDSTDSYSALFIKALSDYAKAGGDTSYLAEHKDEIKTIVDVMFATEGENGYTYAKPDYKVNYLMDNSEVYAGLEGALYLYENVIDDSEMLEKVSEKVEFYRNNFDNDWWFDDHYAAVINSDKTEYTGYGDTWETFYPCATCQMFPVIYGLVDPQSEHSQVAYEGLCNHWSWETMDYKKNGTTVFCWGTFALLGAKMQDTEKFTTYIDTYQEIVDSGRQYPLYSSESAFVLMGCDEMLAR